ncbi:MAG: Inositol-1-monophosphatase (IMPase) (Inositol-1-phosphatase) (I-1-Pase) [Ignavibacteria bacterium]|nr:MAG: Inositol-1-monophosphatase (IMPase) (Inositol-1-phosphatase) (I-1-Pase) [Ignavibacteria bacterium]KAF0160553.1 MAG: Inositol-1-monophosphatase (IMPase) (Inositol-1-phosphatase) (I-1-Pase) [Ignavibacteria bacterium]
MLDKVIYIAREAGEVLRNGFGKNFLVEYKTNVANLVTEYDKRSEKTIIDFIKKEFPTHSVLAEESGSHQSSGEYLWVIDPLDGTTNFAHGLPIFSVSIGVLKKGEMVCGVIYDVMRDAMYTAEKGSGAFCNGRKLCVSTNDDLHKSVLVTGFPYNVHENPDFAYERFTAFLRVARAVRRLGSAAIDMCYVAEGVFDGFWEVSLNAWDMAAGIILVEEAGGKITDFAGNATTIFGKQILASNGKVHQSMINVLRV